MSTSVGIVGELIRLMVIIALTLNVFVLVASNVSYGRWSARQARLLARAGEQVAADGKDALVDALVHIQEMRRDALHTTLMAGVVCVALAFAWTSEQVPK